MKVLTQTPSETHSQQIDYSFLMTVSTRNCYFLTLALDSIRVQFWANSETVAVCDHPSLVDEVDEFLQANQMRGRAYLCEVGLTRSEKFQMAVQKASGNWLLVVDCDDLLPTGCLIKLDKCLRMNPEADYFTSSQQHIDTKNQALKKVPADPRHNTLEYLRNSFAQRHLWGFKRSELAMFSDALNSPFICEDYHFFSTMGMKGKVPLCIPHYLYCYRRHTQQMTQKDSKKINEMVDSIRRKLDTFANKADPRFFITQELRVQARERDMRRMVILA